MASNFFPISLVMWFSQSPTSPFLKKHYRKQLLCCVPQALGKAHKTLGKGFAECNTRQTAHGKYSAGKRLFVECFLSDTRQRLCRLLKQMLGKKKSNVTARRRSRRVCRVSNGLGTRQTCPCLPSAPALTLGKYACLCRVSRP